MKLKSQISSGGRPSKFALIKAAAARQPHGTRARYVGSGCRCLLCRAANSRYSVERDKALRIYGDTRHIVPAEAARKHIIQLSDQGMGYKLVAESSKTSHTIIHEIKMGRRSQIRASTSRAILAVEYDIDALGDRSLIPALDTWRLLDKLLDRGYSKRQLAHWLGFRSPAIQIKRGGLITARTALRVSRMYDQVEEGFLKRG